MEENTSQQRNVPDWAANPFSLFLNHVEELSQITDVSARGISMIRAAPQMKAALVKATGEGEDGIDRLKKLADIACREVDKGFPLLFGQAAVSLWSSLEFLIKDFLITWLMHEPKATQIDPICKIKIPLWQYDQMDQEERGYYIHTRDHSFVYACYDRDICF